MALGVKLLMLGAALTGVSCGGYVVYKNVAGSEKENTEVTKSDVSSPDSSGKGTNTPNSPETGATVQTASERSSTDDSST